MQFKTEKIISGLQGTKVVNDATELTQDFDTIVTLEDTVFTSIKIGGVDVKDEYVTTPANAVKAGAIIRPTQNQVFSGVQLTSGSIAIVL
jgi:hypothetical protein